MTLVPPPFCVIRGIRGIRVCSNSLLMVCQHQSSSDWGQSPNSLQFWSTKLCQDGGLGSGEKEAGRAKSGPASADGSNEEDIASEPN